MSQKTLKKLTAILAAVLAALIILPTVASIITGM